MPSRTAVSAREHGCLDARGQADFARNMPNVQLHRVVADAKRAGNRLVLIRKRHSEDLALAPGQSAWQRLAALPGSSLSADRRSLPRDRRCNGRVHRVRRGGSPRSHRQVPCLQQVATHAQAQRRREILGSSLMVRTSTGVSDPLSAQALQQRNASVGSSAGRGSTESGRCCCSRSHASSRGRSSP